MNNEYYMPMKKIYVKPALKPYDMASMNIMSGSVSMRTRIGLSSFHTDNDDWATEEETTESGTTSTRRYNFWN